VRRRALFWCGWTDLKNPFDFPASVRDLELSVRAARTLGIADEDMHALVCREDLLPQGFAGSQSPATVRALERVLAEIAQSATPDDALLFVATNHGERRGLLTKAEVDEFAEEDEIQLLTPQLLEQALNGVPGRQVLIFAVCRAGIFLPLGQRQDRAVIAACSEDEKYLVQKDPECSPLLRELFRSWCGVELPGYEIDFSQGLRELGAAFAQAELRIGSSDYPPQHRRLKPLLQGTPLWP
jgi:hypothetical protein